MSAVTHTTMMGSTPVSSASTSFICIRLAAVFGVLAAAAMFVDVPLAKLVLAESAGGKHFLPGDLRKFIALNEFFGHAVGAALILLTVFVLDHAARPRVPALMLFAYGPGILADVIKFSVGRIRPLRFDWSLPITDSFVGFFPAIFKSHNLLLSGWTIQSFPSGHTATAVGLAIGLSRLYPHGKWLFATFAALVAIQRVDAGAHWLSDTMASACVACLWGGILERIIAARANRTTEIIKA